MGAEELRALLRRRPFVPLRLHLTDGTTCDIRHPEMALLTRTTVELGFEDQPGSGIADSLEFVSLAYIVRAEFTDGKFAEGKAN